MSLLSQRIPLTIVLCSRQRVESLCALLDSLAANCYNITQYEVLIAGDKDDKETFNFYAKKLGQTEKYLNVRFRFSERQNNLHTRINELVFNLARGYYIWILNDDCIIKDKNWDESIINTLNRYLDINEFHDGIVYGNVPCNSVDKMGTYSSFPVISKAAVETVGFFMPSSIPYWGGDVACYEMYSGLRRDVNIPNLVVDHFLHSDKAAQYSNPLRTEILQWHKDNNLDPLGDLKKFLSTVKDTSVPLVRKIMKDNGLDEFQTKWGLFCRGVALYG